MDENKNETMEIQDGTVKEPAGSIPSPEKSAPQPENFIRTGQSSGKPDGPVEAEAGPAAGAAAGGLRGGDGEDDAGVISEGMMTAMLYDQLMGVFGEGTQLFTMEMPGRVLNQLDYAYPMKDYNSSTLTKPYAVAENEFRLTDGMFDLAPVVQGPNGNRLSSTFETLVNNYTPDISNIKEFVTDKMELRLFLMETITDEIDGEEVTCSRIEFCQRMYMRYLKQKYNWDQEKIDEHVKASSSGDLDGYAKWLATTSWTKDQALENLFQDAVIRGFYHEVLTIMGFLDVQSPAERLAKAKANRRSSVRRSLDASMEILPVQLQPSNWFRSLSPNFSPKDLTLDRQYLAEQYQAKRSVLVSLEAELRVLLLNQSDADALKDMEAQLAALKKQLDQSEAAAFKGFADNMVEAMKLICEIVSNGDIAGLVAGGKESLAASIAGMDGNLLSALGLDAQTAEKLGNMMYDFYARNLDYFTTYNELLDAELEYARAQTNDYSDQIEILKERITIISREVAELQVIVASGAVNQEDGTSADTLLPGNRYNEDSEFMDIVFGRSQVENRMQKDSDSFFTSVKSSMCRFLSSVHAEGEYSLSETSFMKSFLSSDFTIGMRATKVTIDRGGWFDAGILDLTPSYRRLKETISGGAGLSAEGILKEYRTNEDIENGRFSVAAKLVCAPDNGTYLLPAVPMSFLVVKDVVMRAKMSSVSQEDYEKFKKAAFSSSASFMGFRLSGGGAKESFCGLHNLDNNEAQFVMRIPGPQILGWFQELPAKDKSGRYESLSGSEYFEGIIDSLKTYGEKLRELETRRRNGENYIEMATIKAPRREG